MDNKMINKVLMEGFLKENTLEVKKNANNETFISGALNIAIDEFESRKIQLYTTELKKSDGTGAREKNPSFEKISALLPDRTISIASFMKANPSASFEEACQNCSKVWAFGSLQEFNNGKDSITTVKGFSAGIKVSTDTKPFNPRFTFDVDMIIEDYRLELNKEGEETGRLLITGLIPEYDESMSRIQFVTENADVTRGCEKFIERKTITNFRGDLKNFMKKELVNGGANSGFGRPAEPEYRTEFLSENVVCGGSAVVLQFEDCGFSQQIIENGLVKREQKIADNAARTKNNGSGRDYGIASRGFGDVANPTVGATNTAKKFDFAGKF